MTPRGIRNKNPLNIELGDTWQGLAEEQTDGRFCQFRTPEYGIRAAAVILLGYQRRHGCWSIHDIVSRWAPPDENDTVAYINAVAKECNVSTGEVFPLTADHDPNLRNLIKAMGRHENGEYPYTDSETDQGISMARLR